MTQLGKLNPRHSTSQTGTIRVSGTTTNPVVCQSLPTEIIRNFLTVPGIAGIALFDPLIDGYPTPRLYCANSKLKIYQPKVFLANVSQILRTLAHEVQQLDFFFSTYRLYVCRMEFGFTVVVLTDCNVKWPNSSKALRPFCQAVQSHLKPSIQLLEEWASAGISQLDYPPTEPHWAATIDRLPPPAASLPSPSLPLLREYLNAFNHLIAIAAQYLGGTITTNQVKRSRPQGETLAMITIVAKGELTTLDADRVLSPEEFQALRQWTQDLRGRCSKIIRNFDTTAQTAGLTNEEATLLTGVL
jgi:hypothetical protein